MAPTFRLLFTCLLATTVFAGCAKDPAVRSDPSAAGGPDYLVGIRSEYSVPLASLGDVELLGRESVMREALVAGGDDLVVAGTAFRADDVLTLDVIVLNRTPKSFEIARGDLHVFDADGRLLPRLDDVPEGVAWGLRGRGARAGESRAVTGESAFDATWAMDAARLASISEATPRVEVDRRKEPVVPKASARDDTDELPRFGTTDPIAVDTPRLEGSPRRVRVRPDDGKAFWAYFEDAGAPRPLTAMVLIDGEQYLFRFDD